MKKMIIATVLLATLTTVNAQNTTTPAKPTKDPAVMEERAAERADNRTGEMVTELGLSTDQAAKVEAINDRSAKSLAEVKQAGLDDQAQKARMKVVRDGRDNELKAVLTPEQFEKMLVLRKEKKAEHMEKKDTKAPHNE